jgi:sucrose-6-phosphate hydrolase SacC (GH32 family)
MVHHKGRWHLFHQPRPPGNPATVWGRAVSDDLLHWRHLPTAIPCEGRNAIFSGSGLVDWENASGLKRGGVFRSSDLKSWELLQEIGPGARRSHELRRRRHTDPVESARNPYEAPDPPTDPHRCCPHRVLRGKCR